MKIVMTRVASLAVSAVVVTLALFSCAWAGDPTDALRDVFSGVNRVLADSELRKTPAQLRAGIRDVLIHAFDSRETARLALGDEWRGRTPAERDEFASLLADHLERTYVFHIAAYAPLHRPLAIRYLDESIDGRTATVATRLAIPGNDALPVDYRLLQRDGRWAIFDVVIDGASLVASYRALFSGLIAERSYPGLVAWMRARATRAPVGGEAHAPPPTGATPSPTEMARAPDRTAEVVGVPPAPEPGPPQSEAPTPPPAAPGTAYWLQVGAFKNPEAASVLAARLLARNLPVSIDPPTVPPEAHGPALSRVRVGPFGDQAEAAAKLRDLRRSGYQPFLAVERAAP